MPSLKLSKRFSGNLTYLDSIIEQRTNFLTNDCYSLIIFRGLTNDYRIWRAGGGNFLMAIGEFALLNFFSKVYLYLTEPERFVVEQDRDSFTNSINSLIKDNPNQKKFLKSLEKPRIGSVNELYAFKSLIHALPQSIDLGIIRYMIDPEEIWHIYRNVLTHMAWPNSSIDSNGEYPKRMQNLDEIYAYIDMHSTTSFFRIGNVVRCNVDKFNIDLLKISEWIRNQLKNNEFSDENIQHTLNWISKS